jgi:hypothetical protein
MSGAPSTFSTTILGFGIACIGAAIVGGGITIFKNKFPTIRSAWRQVLLGVFGLILCTIAGETTVIAVWRSVFPYKTLIVNLPPTKIEPGQQHTFTVPMKHAGRLEAKIESIESNPPGKEVRVFICSPDDPGNCKNEQLGEGRSIRSLIGDGDNVVNVFSFDSNPSVTVSLIVRHTE